MWHEWTWEYSPCMVKGWMKQQHLIIKPCVYPTERFNLLQWTTTHTMKCVYTLQMWWFKYFICMRSIILIRKVWVASRLQEDPFMGPAAFSQSLVLYPCRNCFAAIFSHFFMSQECFTLDLTQTGGPISLTPTTHHILPRDACWSDGSWLWCSRASSVRFSGLSFEFRKLHTTNTRCLLWRFMFTPWESP